ncbi:MAG: hypothetical protein NW701_19780 [Nitrospira sp.]
MSPFIGLLFRTGSLSILVLTLVGCVKDHAVFITSTKFGIDISQQADQPPKMLVGYKREEGIFLPAEHENSSAAGDTYSVLGYFCVMANPSLWDFIKAIAPFSEDVPDALQITSVFATGLPAQQLAQDDSMREFFQKQITKSKQKTSEKRCN